MEDMEDIGFDDPERLEIDDDILDDTQDVVITKKSSSIPNDRPHGIKEFFSVNSASVRELGLTSVNTASDDLTTLGRIAVDRQFLSHPITSFPTLDYILEKHDPRLSDLLRRVSEYWAKSDVKPNEKLPTQAHRSLLSALIALMLARFNRLRHDDITDVVSACLLYGYRSKDHQEALDFALTDGLVDRHLSGYGQATSLLARTAMQRSCIGLTIGKRIVSDAIMAPCAALLTESAIRLTDTYVSDDDVHYDANRKHGKTLSLLDIIGPMHSATRYVDDKPVEHVIEARRKRIHRDIMLIG